MLRTGILLALSLSVDAMAICCAIGATGAVPRKAMLRVSGSFGFFQGVMPLIGWLTMEKLEWLLAPIDHWIAFFLLGAVGGKMFWDGLTPNPVCDSNKGLARTEGHTLLALSIGTSIDAMAIGSGFTAMDLNPFSTSLLIGVVTFWVCLIAFCVATRFACARQNILEMLGGSVLILIGSRILFQQMGWI